MSLAQTPPDAVILQILTPNLEAEGFRVFPHPARSMLPPFMSGYQPDAIAMKADKQIAIEVKSRSGDADEGRLERLRAMFASHPDWELRVVYAPTKSIQQTIAVMPRRLVAETVDRLLKIFDDSGPIPALLTGWSAFEAAARSLIPNNLGPPQTSGRLLETLASEGGITPAEADALRTLAQLRNDAAHGRLDASVTREQLAELMSVTQTLLKLSEPDTQP